MANQSSMHLIFRTRSLVAFIGVRFFCLVNQSLVSFDVGHLVLTLGPGVFNDLSSFGLFWHLRNSTGKEVIHQFGVLLGQDSLIGLLLSSFALSLTLVVES